VEKTVVYLILCFLVAIIFYGVYKCILIIFNTLFGDTSINEFGLKIDMKPFDIKIDKHNPFQWFWSRIMIGLVFPSIGILVLVLLLYNLFVAVSSNF